MKTVRDGLKWVNLLLSLVLAFTLAGCGGGGGGGGAAAGGGGGAAPTTTTVSGKVTLSTTVTGKPAMMATVLNKARLQKAGKGYKPGASQGTNLLKALSAVTVSAPTALSSATIELYDADKPEWMSPVAIALSDSTGTYSLSTLTNAASNLKADGTAAYVDGDPIPTGNYTIIASKYDSGYGKLFVAVQAIVKKFAGTVAGNDLVAQDSDAIPTVVSMLGLSKNADGTFGSSTTPVPVNAHIQVTFSMAMARQSVIDGMKFVPSGSTTALAGKWKVSPDLTAVTFYPTSDLIPNTVYTITVGGGKSLKTAKNVYGKTIAADVTCSFKSAPKDPNPPTAVRNSPANATIASSMPITTPIRIGADEELDITSIGVTSSPSIGDKPAIKYVGKSTAAADASYPYIYEIVPSAALQMGTTYSIGVSGAVDMAGNTMNVLNFSFTTEATSAGVTGTTVTEVNAQLAVKDVLGKWVNAMNARNSALLSSYMSGDFYWINDTSKGMSQDDLNRDGRLSLNEFTSMLNTWFKDLDRCGSTVTGDVDLANGGIAVNGSTATIAFTLTATPTNTTDSTCNNGPNNTLYATMENINQAWLMTRGSEMKLTTYPPALTPIDLVSPANGNQYPEPTANQPLTPEFKWTAGTGISTYMVVLIDNKSRHLQNGWVALVDGSTTAAGSPISAKFNGKAGDYGNMVVIDLTKNNPLGFSNMITEIKSGGSYSWAVIGFKTKTLADFKNINFDPSLYLIASSANNGFTVNGVWKELTVKVVGGASGTVYTYSDNADGYSVGSENSVTLTVTTPNATATAGSVWVDGYTSKSYPLTFAMVNGVNTATATISLSNKRNWVSLDDGSGKYFTWFGIYTTGGAGPKVVISSVTAKNCSGGAATLTGPDSWDNYTGPDTCTVSVSGTVDPLITSLSVNVWNNNGNGNYNKQVTLTGATFSVVDIPVYKGNNWVSVSNWNMSTSENNQNGFGVDTQAGSTYVAPITASVTGTGVTMTSSDIWQSYWDAAALSSVTVNVTMPLNTGMGGYNFFSDPNWTYHTTGMITGTAQNTFAVTLYQGWNYIDLYDGNGNWYTLNIYTTGGTAYQQPNVVTSVSGGPTTLTPTPSYGYYKYDAGSACSVTVNGSTTTAGTVNVYMSYYNSATGASVYESQAVTASAGTYTFNQNVYGGGTNSIDISDASWNWQGVQVTTTCSTVPTVFAVTSVTNGTSAITADTYGTYNTTVPALTVNGSASTGKTITAYVSGLYYSQYTTTASGNAFSMNIPIYMGYDYISLTDGSNWVYLNAYTTSNLTVWTPLINTVTVSGATLSSGGGTSDTWSSWNTSLGTVDISGKASNNGTGSYTQSGANYATGTLTISGGAFTLTGVTLGYGYNYFTLYDASWNSYYLTIYTSGGTGAPAKIVKITSPAQNATASGAITVTGTIDTTTIVAPATIGFTPVYVYGYVYDYTTGASTYYSNATADQNWAQPLTYSAGSFSFNTSVTAGETYIEVYAFDASWLISHGHGIYVNNTYGWSDYSYKPGSKATAGNAKAKAHQAEFDKKMMRHKTR